MFRTMSLIALGTHTAFAHAQLYKHYSPATGVTIFSNARVLEPGRERESGPRQALAMAGAAATDTSHVPAAPAKPIVAPPEKLTAQAIPATASSHGTQPASGQRSPTAASMEQPLPKTLAHTKAVGYKDFPRISPEVQQARDNERRRILQDELAMEQALLDQSIAAKAALAVLQRHRANLEALQREISHAR